MKNYFIFIGVSDGKPSDTNIIYDIEAIYTFAVERVKLNLLILTF